MRMVGYLGYPLLTAHSEYCILGRRRGGRARGGNDEEKG